MVDVAPTAGDVFLDSSGPWIVFCLIDDRVGGIGSLDEHLAPVDDVEAAVGLADTSAGEVVGGAVVAACCPGDSAVDDGGIVSAEAEGRAAAVFVLYACLVCECSCRCVCMKCLCAAATVWPAFVSRARKSPAKVQRK